MQSTALGRIISPLIQATAGLNLSRESEDAAPVVDLERMARRVVAHERAEAYNRKAQTPDHCEPDIEGVVRKQLLDLAMPDTSEQRLLVEAPTTFSPVPVLLDSDQVQLLKINFSSLTMRSRFSGKRNPSQYGEMDVVSLLTSLTRGQKVMNLSKSEFLTQLVNSCTGEPHALASDFLRQDEEGGMSVASIYLRFTDSYFFDLPPDQALSRLQDVSTGKVRFASLSEAEMEIRKLSRLAALTGSTLPKRKMLEVMHFRKFFLAILPDKFLSVVLQAIDRVETLKNRDVTIDELVLVFRKYRISIDRELFNKSKKQGQVNQAQGAGRGNGRRRRGGAQGGSQAAATVGQVQTRSMTKGCDSPQQGNDNPGPSHTGSKPWKKRSRGRGSGSNPNTTPLGSQNAHTTQGPKKNGALGMSVCSLCGQPTHQFDACPLFKPHERVVTIDKCPCPLNSFHLKKFCPIIIQKN